MGNSTLKGKDLRKINFRGNKAIGLGINIMARHYKHLPKQEKLTLLTNVLDQPNQFINHEFLAPLANELQEPPPVKVLREKELFTAPLDYRVYGRKHIDDNTLRQMDLVMSLPVAKAGALMPDAHVGYGFPIGGVLATQKAVIPYGVGLDIGCRMCLTLFGPGPGYMDRYRHQFKTALKENTHFGISTLSEATMDHEVLDRPEFQETSLLKKLHGKAWRQLGTSGSGNHFVEFGAVNLRVGNALDLPAGEYLGLLSHSGSRGLGAAIAQHYTNVARDRCKLPRQVQALAWLDLDTDAGEAYWRAMNLAGDYAKACHDVIHHRLSKALGLKPIGRVENHHNFAWKEAGPDGEECIIHRKGATPAHEGELGIIPATMVTPGYIVSGRGAGGALHSASHGAGRKVSRTKARQSFTNSVFRKKVKSAGVQLIGGGVDESPWAYKDLEEVMASQQELVQIEGSFHPRIVRMDKP